MDPQPDQDLDLRLQKLEADLNQTSTPTTHTASEKLKPQTDTQTVQSTLNQFINWFNGLAGFGKLIAIGVTTLVGFAILRTVLHLVASLISLGLLGLLLYFAYKFFLARSSDKG